MYNVIFKIINNIFKILQKKTSMTKSIDLFDVFLLLCVFISTDIACSLFLQHLFLFGFLIYIWCRSWCAPHIYIDKTERHTAIRLWRMVRFWWFRWRRWYIYIYCGLVLSLYDLLYFLCVGFCVHLQGLIVIKTKNITRKNQVEIIIMS